MDVLDHLIDEHRQVEVMLEKLAASEEGPSRETTLRELTTSLSTHMKVEERFVYPIVRDVVGEEDEQEAETEHGLTREGLTKLHQLVDAPGFGAAVDMITAGIKHHVDEEEKEIFPQLRDKAQDRLAELGDPDDLEQRVTSDDGSAGPTKLELYEEAKEAGIVGRSTMSKDELAKALDK